MKISLGQRAGILVFLVLLFDQSLKIWVKTHMMMGQEHPILGSWFIIHFMENNGMAYGMEFGGHLGKLLLSLFRIVAVFGIGWYLIYLIRTKAHLGLVLSFALIFSGAIGNILDSAFYGMIFDESDGQLAQIFTNNPYSSFLHGRVVDMLYFPVIQGHFPAWFPFWGSESFIFFRPIFNIADSSITIGVILILLFQRRFFFKN